MNRLNGYAGNILKVDLSTKSVVKMPLRQELITKFLGGAGINARLAYDTIKSGTEPFSPQNALVFGVGPLVGTLVPGAGRSNLTSKSPSSRFIGTSGSGHLGMLKFAGYDHVVITGKADRPVYLKIGDDVEIREAGHIWGKDTWEATDAIWQEIGRKHAVLSIGPAGENLVRDAGVIANKYSAYARTGMGAIMGSKNLKAIGAYGSRGITAAQPKRFMELVNKLCRELASLPYEGFRRLGTLEYLAPILDAGLLPYKNFRETAGREFLQGFDVEKLMEGVDRRHLSCFSCPVGCKHTLHGKEGGECADLALPISCVFAPVLGAINCGLRTWPQMFRFAEMCNRLGMDYFSTSGLVSMAIELYERGIINKSDTGGMSLDWDAGTLHRLVKDIAYRKDFGNVLADGLIEAPQRIGRGADDYAIHIKGITASELRALFSTTVFSYIINVIGQDSQANKLLVGATTEELGRYCRKVGMTEKDMERILTGPEGYNLARMTKWGEDYHFTLECLGLCTHFIYQEFDASVWADLYSAATGIDVDAAGLFEMAARGRDMRRAFNIREGATRKDDRVPKRLLTESVRVGAAMNPPVSQKYIDGLITEYYEERGWDPQEGTLRPGRLAELTDS